MRTKTTSQFFASCLLLIVPATVHSQRPSGIVVDGKDSVTQAPGPQYRAGSLTRALVGGGWRDVWVTPVTAPVLDIDTYAGGLKLEERGGGFHSFVLHLDEEKGWREYRFRSVDKFPQQGLPDALKGTAVGRLLEDQVSIFFPAGPLLVPPLLRAIGALHVTPELYVMGDSRRLGAVRDTAVGMLGTFELKGQEAPDDEPGFAGSRKIKGSENFLEDILESQAHRVDEREYLAVRLVDFLINDPDRTLDNFDWARFGDKGNYTWRPLPRDRDQVFMNARGLLNTLVIHAFYPKQIAFTPDIPLRGLTYTSHALDRRLLQRLDAAAFSEVATRVQQALDDAVIEQVIEAMPAPWRSNTTADDRIRSILRYRRDHLPQVAMEFYGDLAGEVDVHGTDEADRVDVVRHDDGRVTVTITAPGQSATVARRTDGTVVTTSGGDVTGRGESAFFARTFVPGATKEIRVYAHGNDDIAVVRGVARNDIRVRIIGGKGDDILADSAGGNKTVLYDEDGTNTLVAAGDTRIHTRPWKPLEVPTGFWRGEDWKPDWGGSSGWAPTVDYNTGSGVIVGIGHRFKKYGFRRLPYQWQGGATLLAGTRSSRFGLEFDADYRFENSPGAIQVEGRVTQLDATRFFGYGNNTPILAREQNLVDQTVISVAPSFVWHLGWREREGGGNSLRGEDTLHVGLRPLIGELSVGPVVSWIDPEPTAASALLASGVRGSSSFATAGARVGLELDRTDDAPVPTKGWTLAAGLAGYPVNDAFGVAHANGSAYLPLGKLGGPHLAFRAGGAIAAGDYPVQYAATVGGKNTLRGYSFRRFAGDAAANGGAELRVPVGTLNFLVRSNVGLFALVDAGRVWFDGSSDGGWHSSAGGGIWFAALGHAVSVAYARGESQRFYLKSGLFY